MGVCFDCLVEVDGTPNVQACMVAVRDGMRVRLQHGARRFEGGT
jgi:NADH dehydrogenase/NADH:ubiquinone oxidoreductase subunit G